MTQVLPAWFLEDGNLKVWHRTMEKDAPRIALCGKPLQPVSELEPPGEQCPNCEELLETLIREEQESRKGTARFGDSVKD